MLTPEERQAAEMQGRALGCGCVVLFWTFVALALTNALLIGWLWS